MGEEGAVEARGRSGGLLKRAFAWGHVRTLWIPFLVVLLCLFAGTGIRGWTFRHVASVCGWLYLLGLGYFLVLAVINFIKRRKAAGLGALLCLVICGVMFLPALLLALVTGAGGDGFADDLKIPEGLEVVEPGRGVSRGEPGGDADVFQAALRASVELEDGNDDTSVRAEIPALAVLWAERRDLLMRYLASHPGWRVYEDKKGKFATRRWMVGDRWWMSLHGYYSRPRSSPPKPGLPSFQTRTTLGFSGQPWGNGGQRLAGGEEAVVELRVGNGILKSYVTFEAGGVLVELFEQGEVAERRMTKAAIEEMEREFSALAAVAGWEEAEGLLPEGAIGRGEPRIELMNSSQPGIYNAAVWCNPGESGRVYLKAFEVTREYGLSADRIKLRTNEWAGWSADAGELFFTEMHFTIYEGDWDQPYAARLELWFEPDSGAGERKLIEENFRVEGWMR